MTLKKISLIIIATLFSLASFAFAWVQIMPSATMLVSNEIARISNTKCPKNSNKIECKYIEALHAQQ